MTQKTKGLVIVHTGNGKGKTTAALGMAMRAVGYQMNVLIVQFMKGTWSYGEENAVKMLTPYLELKKMGVGFYKILDDNRTDEEHREAALHAYQEALKALASNFYSIVILDEINVALDMKLLTLEEVVELIQSKPEKVHLVLTGRNAHPRIIEIADLVTEMREIKHPFNEGIIAQKGVEF